MSLYLTAGRLATHSFAQNANEWGTHFVYSGDHGDVAKAFGAEHAAVTFDFFWRAERLGVVVGELDGGLAFDCGYLADQADGVKVGAARGITAAEIVGQQSSPTCAEANAAASGPLFRIVEIGGAAEVICRTGASRDRPAKVCVQAEDVIDVECVGGDDELVTRVSPATLEPLNIFVAGNVGILAVDALTGPIGGPVGGIIEKL